jgi:hypothetical protein
VQVWNTETIDGYGEGQAGSCHVDGLAAVKDGRGAWTEGPRTERLAVGG